LSNQLNVIGDSQMDWNRVAGNWKQLKGKAKEQWGKLTDDDLDVISGRRDQLEGKIQERYGYAKDQVRKEVDDWYHRQKWSTPIAGIDDAALAGSGRASRLIGSKVFKGDTSIGKIEDVLVELEHARLTAVILSLGGGFLGIGDKLVAVPANHIMAGSEGRFVTDLTEAQLASAPAFDFSIVDQQFTT
jgi:uncharacterized protein YjbJ (UPF0337 family)/sporulation protein YlmC with PRC-barrel domain